MVRKFKNFVRQNKLFNPSDNVILSVSGGIDSMSMAWLFELCGYKYSIAHCNFHLRGKESDEDARFVEKYSKKKKVKFYLENFDAKSFADQHKISIQMAARQLRIKWLECLSEQHKYRYYATAHHKDDQIETFFINLLRGTGISGLHGIIPLQGRLIHPMLFTNRKEIEIFAKEKKIPYREDSSNLRSDYKRNKVRHQLLPLIKEINPHYAEIFTDNINRLKQAETIYLQQIKSAASHVIKTHDNQVKISVSLLLELDPIETYLYEFISQFNFNFTEVRNIIKTLDKQSGKQFLSKSHRLFKDRDHLIIEKIKEKEPNDITYKIFKDTLELTVPLKMEFDFINKTPDFKFIDDRNQAYLDADKLSYPLLIRKWERGDYFYPLGMKRKKLLSDFFIDNKFSIPAKEKIWLLISNDQVVWIIGQRIDNRFKVTPETQNVYIAQMMGRESL
jgi:tRNA(Ile)-lysidine synthase